MNTTHPTHRHRFEVITATVSTRAKKSLGKLLAALEGYVSGAGTRSVHTSLEGTTLTLRFDGCRVVGEDFLDADCELLDAVREELDRCPAVKAY